MVALELFMVASIAIFAIIGYMFYIGIIRGKRLSALAGLAFAFVIVGMVFGDDRSIGYSLIGIGIIIAIIDMVLKPKKK